MCAGPGCRQPGTPQILVNTATLNLVVRVVDLNFGALPGDFSLERFYNLEDTRTGPFGNRWSFRLGESLTAGPDDIVVLRRGSGQIDRFAPALQPGRYFALTNTADTLTRNPDGTFVLAAAGSTSSRIFSAEGRLLAIREGGPPRVTLSYDSGGRLVEARPRGALVRFGYDDAGRITTVSDSAGRSLAFAYTADGNLAQQTNADGQTVSYQYDDAGLLASITTPGGVTNVQLSSDGPGVAAITLPDGTTRQYGTFRTPGQVQVTDGAGSSTVYASTALGLTESITDAAGNRTSFGYDAVGRRIRVTTANGETARFEYDGAGNLTAVVDALGNRWQAQYGGARLTHLTDPKGNAYDLRYDAAGNLIAVTNPLGGGVSLASNAAGLITALTDPNGNQQSFEYHADGLLTAWTDAVGGRHGFQYDGAGRVGVRSEPDGRTIAAEYDTSSRLAAASAGGERVEFAPALERDGLGRVVKSTDGFGNQVGYRYEASGRLARIVLPGDRFFAYEYDAAGRLSKVSDWLGNFALYRYDANGSPLSVNVSGGPITIYQYDAARNLRGLVSTGPDGGVVAGYRYTLDADGNRTAVSALEPSTAPIGLESGARSYDAANRLIGRDNGATYLYDAAGNLVEIRGGPRPATLTYDAFGRLKSFSAESATSYAYGASGLRVERNRDGEVRRFVYDLSGRAPRVVMETDGDGNALAFYAWGLGLLWKNSWDGKSYFYHFDGDGNVVALTDPAAGVVNRYRYTPRGVLAASEESVENAFRAGGEAGWMDDGNGLLYNDGRFLFPELGVALSGSVELNPPQPAALPRLRGAGLCFFGSVAECKP